MRFTHSQQYMLMKELEASLGQYHRVRNGETEELFAHLSKWHHAQRRKGTFMKRLLRAYERKGITPYETLRTHIINALCPDNAPAHVAKSLLEMKTWKVSL